MPTNLIEDYAYVRSRDVTSPTDNISVLELVEEMVRAPGDHHWDVHSSGTLSDDGPSDQYYLVLSGSDPDQPAQRIAFLASLDSFEVGYDPDGTVEWDDEEGDFVHDGAFSGLRTLAGSTLELVDSELVPFVLDLNDEAPIRVWLAEHREANDCGETCSTGLAASLTLLIEKVIISDETQNRFVYGAHVGRVLSSTNLNDQHRGIYGDAVLVGEPNTPGRLGPEEPVSDPDYRSWLGQPNNVGGSVVRVGPEEWAAAYGVGWDNHLPEGSLKDVASSKRVVPYGVNGLDEDPILGDWLMVSAGLDHSLGIRKDGTLWAWGDNFYGQLGNGRTVLGQNNTFTDPPDSNVPIPVTLDGHPNVWKHVSAGRHYSLGIDINGKAWAWGRNSSGQLGDGTTNRKTVPTAVDTGNVQSWKQLSAGAFHSLGIDVNGKAWAWGSNDNGQLGVIDLASIEVPMAVDTDGGRPATWKQLSAGFEHSLGIAADDAAWAWGRNGSGQLGDGTTEQKTVPTAVDTGNVQSWKQLSAGFQHSLGIAADDAAWAWGLNGNGQLGDDDPPTQKTVPTAVDTGNVQSWKQLSAGLQYSLGIAADDAAWAWGRNSFGQLGNGTTEQKDVPTEVSTADGRPTTWKQLSGGNQYSLGIAADDAAWAWGLNDNGQLGDGTTDQSNVPKDISYVYKIYNACTHGEVGRTKYLRQFGTEPLAHGVKFVSTTPESLQAWLPSGNGSNQLILWRRGDDNDSESET